MTDGLDNPAWAALTGPQAQFAIGDGRARRYRDDVAPFAAVADDDDPDAWGELDQLGSDLVVVIRPRSVVPPGWTLVQELPGDQLVYDRALPDEPGSGDIVGLGRADVPQMLALVELTQPGPFRPRTVDLGGYRGIRDGDALIAMAGYRMQPAGAVEISAVCTHPGYRGRGLARQLIHSVIADVQRSGRLPFLHVARSNVGAAAVYQALGFAHRRELYFLVLGARREP